MCLKFHCSLPWCLEAAAAAAGAFMDGAEVVEEQDPLCLSESTFAALKEFLEEQKDEEKLAKEDPFAENWGLSQVGIMDVDQS